MVLGPVPPAPVAALGDHQLLERQLARLGRNAGAGGGLIIGLARARQVLPGAVVLFGSDPDVEIRADPGAREDVVEWLRLYLGQPLAHGERVNLRVGRDASIELAEKGTPVRVVVFPGVLAVQNDGYERVAAAGENAPAVLADAVQEVPRRLGRAHALVDEPDEVAQVVIPEHEGHLAALATPTVGPVGVVDARRAL